MAAINQRPRIPPEIISLIIEEMSPNPVSDTGEWTSTLTACALTSKVFVKPAQKCLFRHVRLCWIGTSNGDARYMKFMTALELSPGNALFIQALSLEYSSGSMTQPGLPKILGMMRNLKDFYLCSLSYDGSAHDSMEAFSALFRLPSLVEVTITSLNNHGLEEEVDHMFELARETFALPLEEKLAFGQIPKPGEIPRCYKPAGRLRDQFGKPDTMEFLTLSKDDALSWPTLIHRTYPKFVLSRMEDTVNPYVVKATQVNHTILDVFNGKLGLLPGTLVDIHGSQESTSEARIIKSFARKEIVNEGDVTLGSHTDFGSLTLLHNILGGLQLQVPGSDEWHYVKPVPGHIICNIGDTLSIFSNGILKSGLHRVVPAPGEQALIDRYSIAYFTRPGNKEMLHPLLATGKGNEESRFDVGVTGFEWYISRIKQFQRGIGVANV